MGRERSFFPPQIANAVRAELWGTGVGVQAPSAVGLSGAALGEPEGIPQPRRHKAKGQLFVVRDLQAASCQRRARGVSESPIEDSAIGAHKTFGPKATTEALEMAVLPTPTRIF